jgi:hypothetical protein
MSMNVHYIPGDATKLEETADAGKLGEKYVPIIVTWDESVRGTYPVTMDVLSALRSEPQAVYYTDGNAPFVGRLMDIEGDGDPDSPYLEWELRIQPTRFAVGDEAHPWPVS